MELDSDLAANVREKESVLQSGQESFRRINARKLRLSGEVDGLRLQMGWREKYFRGWFGGNKRLVREVRELGRELADVEAELQAKNEAVLAAERDCIAVVADYLDNNDPEFRELNKRRTEVGKVKSAADELAAAIDRALKEVNDAQGMETLDLFSKNKGISILSHMENAEANEAIGEVEEAAKRFRESLDSYRAVMLEAGPAVAGLGRIDDNIDLILDLVGDGFDFMSFFTLSQLNDAEESLRKLRRQFAGPCQGIDAKYAALCDQCDQRIAEARRACS